MTYAKPELVELTQAVEAIQGNYKTLVFHCDCQYALEEPAYEADE